MNFAQELKRVWYGRTSPVLPVEKVVKCKVLWCATNGDKVRHAHLAGFRVCDPRQLVCDPSWWTRYWKQPKGYCLVCRGKVREESLGVSSRLRKVCLHLNSRAVRSVGKTLTLRRCATCGVFLAKEKKLEKV